MTVDGVVDRIDEWFKPQPDSQQDVRELLFAASAMLQGRPTFEGLAGVWPSITDDSGFADRINSMRKYVASATLSEPLPWNGTLLVGDLVSAVAKLKAELHGPLVSYGCGELAYQLAAAGLVDELRLIVHPVVMGEGARPFGGRGPMRLDPIEVKRYESGVVMLRYRPTGA